MFNSSGKPLRRLSCAGVTYLLALAGFGCDEILGFEGGDDLRRAEGTLRPGDASNAEPTPPPPDCNLYCDSVLNACVQNPVYIARSECLAFCEQLQRFDPTGLQCRLDAVPQRTDDTLDVCKQAGPGGFSEQIPERCSADLCGTYCTLMAGICPETGLAQGSGRDAGPSATEDRSGCLQICSRLEDQESGYLAMMGNPNSPSCRIFHLGLAIRAPNERELHCRHAAGQLLCVPPAPAAP